ncbi:MAG: ECF transporter S component, partial [Promethearchaeota archaeon]
METKTENKEGSIKRLRDSEAFIQATEKERDNGSIWIDKKTFKIVLISMFSALAVVLGYALAYIPNVELFTLTIFLGGFILGKRDGLVIGLLSSLIFVFFNPYETSPLI